MSRRALVFFMGAVVFVLAYWGTSKIMNRAEFKKKFLAAAARVDALIDPITKERGLKGFNPFVLLAHASLESGDGSGRIAAFNNIFSLQAGSAWRGPTVAQGGTGNKFRTYATYDAAIVDFINLIIGWPSNYGPVAIAARNNDIAGYAAGLKLAPKPYDDSSKTYIQDMIARYNTLTM